MSTLSINAPEQHLTLGNSDPLRDMYQELAEDFETCLLTVVSQFVKQEYYANGVEMEVRKVDCATTEGGRDA
jgi:hypothetical protein